MKKLLLVLPAMALMAACDTPTQSAFAGAGAGAAAGALVSSKDDRLAGAAIGSTIGAIAGDYAGRQKEANTCTYRNSAGQTYQAACP
ncbi:glycine zipper 2TM domain-containing protein [Albirhodobacter sp. R86504]|jgi:outer membrane lipoprotein SlyB|uniref:glycine zipper 2TM domain-containing protein n=1 Tax=Albirhodobacter sp. R86504 TaxID=3093848 RepID=UPI0036714904